MDSTRDESVMADAPHHAEMSNSSPELVWSIIRRNSRYVPIVCGVSSTDGAAVDS